MKIIGIGKNYVNNFSELPEGEVIPMIFTKADTTLLEDDKDLLLPSISSDVWYEVEIAIRIGKSSKNIKADEALSCIDAIALANDLTAKDVLKESREGNKGPWALAKGFDGATPIAKFINISEFKDISNINFSLNVNGEERQVGNTSLMITSIPKFIEYVSSYMTLTPGDILLTGTPASGVAKLNSGDLMEGYLEGKKVMTTKVI